jgi:hypothetical protein
METNLFDFNWEPFAQFGLAGLILGVFFVLLVFILKQNAKVVSSIVERMSSDHKDSNDAWRKAFESHSDRSDTRQAETNEVLRDLTKVMAENNVNVQHYHAHRKDKLSHGI